MLSFVKLLPRNESAQERFYSPRNMCYPRGDVQKRLESCVLDRQQAVHTARIGQSYPDKLPRVLTDVPGGVMQRITTFPGDDMAWNISWYFCTGILDLGRWVVMRRKGNKCRYRSGRNIRTVHTL
jgi:hypothetical protein